MNINFSNRYYLAAIACWFAFSCNPLLAGNIILKKNKTAYHWQSSDSNRSPEWKETGSNEHGTGIDYNKPGTADSLNHNQVKKRNVAIFIHNGVEILDFAGPSEVFASTEGFNVYTVSLSTEPIISQGFIKIIPNYNLTDCPDPDIVVLPGGETGPFLENKPLIDWIKSTAAHAEVMLSVCTGAGLLGKAGLLDGKQATTFHSYIGKLQRATPNAKILSETRFVDNGQIITTAGVSAGIDGALHVVAKLKGQAVAIQTATYMEYDKWKPEDGLIVKQLPKNTPEKK